MKFECTAFLENSDERLRMYLINVPIIGSVVFNQRSGYDDLIEYTIVEANYDQRLGLLLDNSI